MCEYIVINECSVFQRSSHGETDARVMMMSVSNCARPDDDDDDDVDCVWLEL